MPSRRGAGAASDHSSGAASRPLTLLRSRFATPRVAEQVDAAIRSGRGKG